LCTVTPAIVLAGGWEAAFYTFGAAAIFWFPFWAASSFEVVSDASAGGTYGTEGGAKVGVIDEWLALVKTREVKAICVAQFAQSWGGYGLLSWLPTYFEEALGVPLGDLPAFTVLPYFIQGIVGVASGIVADRWLREGRFDVKFIRRAFQTAGMVGPAACLTGAAILGGAGATETNVFAAAVLVDVGLALSALTLAGVSVSHLDVAPRHAGLVFATGNTCATIAGVIAVPLSGFVLEATGQSWSTVFGIIAVLYVVGAAYWWACVGDEPVPEDSL
jgi:MFS transporter, ACS family, solute carrier family 17 (sodium-dependent inorganic phosphate cotransporter), other